MREVLRYAVFVTKEKQRFALVAVLLLWCVLLIAYQMTRGQIGLGRAMVWNLFLALLPLLFGLAFRKCVQRENRFLTGVFFVLWLLFLPNAPYLLTDLVHLTSAYDPHPAKLWSLLAMLLACAGTGTLLGYFSLLDVQQAIERKRGARDGWIVAVSSLMLCGFGIYLGRFLRWNSWDALLQPLRLAKVVAEKTFDFTAQPQPIVVTFVFGIGLILGYLALRVFAAGLQEK